MTDNGLSSLPQSSPREFEFLMQEFDKTLRVHKETADEDGGIAAVRPLMAGRLEVWSKEGDWLLTPYSGLITVSHLKCLS